METLSTILVFDSKETSTCSPIVKKNCGYSLLRCFLFQMPLRHNVLKSILFVLPKNSECMVNMLSNGW